MRQDYTHVGILVDRSGSMNDPGKKGLPSHELYLPENTLLGVLKEQVTTFVAAQEAVPGKFTVNYAVFDHEYVRIDSLKDIRPRGNTALYDALYRFIDDEGGFLSAMPEEERPSKVIILVVTDGQENGSVEVTGALVQAKVQHQESTYGWNFIYLGAELDFKTATNISKGVAIQASRSYSGNISQSFNELSRSVDLYRSTGDSKSLDRSN